jgi:hypothetical protein
LCFGGMFCFAVYKEHCGNCLFTSGALKTRKSVTNAISVLSS